MSQAVNQIYFRYKCPSTAAYLVDSKTCDLRREKAKTSNDVELERCRDCPGPEILSDPRPVDLKVVPPKETKKERKKEAKKEIKKEKPAAQDLRCKNHPDRPAVIRKDGQTTGKCKECQKNSITAAKDLSVKKRKEMSMAVRMHPVLMEVVCATERVEDVLLELLEEPGKARGLVIAAKELTITLRLAARVGAIPGWPEEEKGQAGQTDELQGAS